MTTSQVDATDAAVSLAAEHGIDLADVGGTGANGRITKGDVEAHLASLAVAAEAVEAAVEETAVVPAAEAEPEAPAGPRAGEAVPSETNVRAQTPDEAETAAAAFADRVQAAGTLQALIALGSQATSEEERKLIRARAKELLEK